MSLPVAILVGSLATRLRPITERIPKSLVDVAGQPFAVHQIHWGTGAQEDWGVAVELVERRRIRHGLFFAQLAIEKALKAHVCRRTQDLAPRVHNLVRLAELAGLQPAETGTHGDPVPVVSTCDNEEAMDTRVLRRAFSVDEFHRMADAGVFGEDDRVELLAGEVIEMSPIGSRHAGCVARLSDTFWQRVSATAIVNVQNPLVLDEQAELYPDIALLKRRPDFYAQSLPRARDVLLVVEVADTTGGYDRGVKVPLYARAGIPETWVIDLTERTVDVYRRPSAGSYQDHHRFGPGGRLNSSQVPGLEVSVADIMS